MVAPVTVRGRDLRALAAIVSENRRTLQERIRGEVHARAKGSSHSRTSRAAAVIAARVAHDSDFADEFIGIVEGGDKATPEAFARSAGVKVSEVEIIPIENGVCICRGHFCMPCGNAA
jgi:hypothetical protein